MTPSDWIASLVSRIERGASENDRFEIGRGLSRAQRILFFEHATPDQHEAYKHIVWQGASLEDADYVRTFRAADARSNVLAAKRRSVIEAQGFDAADAAVHLRVLQRDVDAGSTKFLVAFIDPRKRNRPKHEVVTLDEMRSTVPAMQKLGYDAFVAVHAFEGTRRSQEHVVRLRAYFVDLDLGKEGANRAGAMRFRYARILVRLKQLPPDLIVWSGNGMHVYWMIEPDDPASSDLQLWSERESRLVAKFGGDPAVKDAARVLRLAGSLNSKNVDEPKRCCVIYRSKRLLSADAPVPIHNGALLANRGTDRVPSPRPSVGGARPRDVHADHRVERILSRLDVVRGPRRQPAETSWECRCPNPEHQDRNPSFVVLLKPDGTIRLLCRSRCAGMQTGQLLALLGLPAELSETAAQLWSRAGWYHNVAPDSVVVGNGLVSSVLERLEQMGLEPLQFNSEIAAWAFFCLLPSA